MEKKRSIGITITGVIFIVWPLLYLLKILLTLLNLDHFYPFSNLWDILKPTFVLQKVLYIICGIGILKLAKLARVLVLCISLFGIVVWVAAIFLQTPLMLWNKIIHIVAYVMFCLFLTRSKVKEQFR